MELHVGVSVALQDAGEATRSLELARGLRDRCPPGWTVRCTFLSHGSSFEPMVREAGFDVHKCEPALEGRSVVHDLGIDWPHPRHMIGSAELAAALIRGQRDALARLRPDVVLHGFWIPGNLAAQLLDLPRICFQPLPLHPDVLPHLLLDLPDEAGPLAALPGPIRRSLLRAVPRGLVRRIPAFQQPRLTRGALEAGWIGPPPRTLFDMLRADLTVVNDLPDFYHGLRLPDGFRVTGPLFPRNSGDEALDPEIAELFGPDDGLPRVFCAMGSSGSAHMLLEAAQALAAGAGTHWRALVVASPAVCPLPRVRARVGVRPGLVVTDHFVPARALSALADVVVSHGGQGTVQTALSTGAPLVGVAMMMEQQINLDHVARSGAGIRIPSPIWHAGRIEHAVRHVLAEPRYRAAARRLQTAIEQLDGRAAAADALWEHVRSRPGHAPTTTATG